MYPTRYQLPELTAHLLSVLERRRAGFSEWNAECEAKLAGDARDALAEAGRQFAELTDDKPYWRRVEQSVNEVVLPRYFKLAREESELEKKKFGLWRGGDLIARATYAVLGLVSGWLLLRTGIPRAFEVLPAALFIAGPLVPDLQVWLAKRRYAGRLRAVVDDMRLEAAQREQYRPILEAIDPGPVSDPTKTPDRVKEKP